ncbi:CPBP family intramembrane glutamic endopeptidase [Enterococcus sp. BWR-S5]|uniref:CPBP family intramembrane glutamic endopeptidase n=1 Tax=Enterococcus sp. BWR-S5 TaxID=2787714 RepID=UPI00192511F3|nr:CPBP family intramembrane glutamic endopeptidase [Enterococcus sp. BWR-S5]MBL1225787.1 CPBP family intramembrane metalloprotease [Enterococcus sp. BWR-S5]
MDNLIWRLLTDFLGNFLIIFLLLLPVILKKWSLEEFGLTKKSSVAVIVLSIVYSILFIYNNDFTLEGYYTFFYFLVFVAFSEEFLYRGYLFNKIDQEYGFWISVIISGLFFGIGHAMLPTIMQGESLSFFITQAMSNILGQGIFSSLLFSLAFKKSSNLLVPVLIHAILDYAGIVFS